MSHDDERANRDETSPEEATRTETSHERGSRTETGRDQQASAEQTPDAGTGAPQDGRERSAGDGRTTGQGGGRPAQGSGRGAGQAAGQAFDSARSRLSSPAAKSQIKYVLGLFAVVGAGFGITGFLTLELLAGGSGFGGQLLSGIFAVALLGVVLLIGPVIAVYSSLNADDGLYQEPRTAYLTSFVSNTVGYFVMVLIAVVLIGLAVSGGGGGGGTSGGGGAFDVLGLLVPLIVLSIPVGLVGIGSTYLHRGRVGGNRRRTEVAT